MNREEINGKFQYKAIVMRNGEKCSQTVFSDWFANDTDAKNGYTALMTEQGYKVLDVEIDEITRVHIK